ncbi:MAG: hypothetical protein ACRELD_09115 [Longimicrobiales bacterium]
MLATNLARVEGLPVISSARMYEVLGQLGGLAGAGASVADAARAAGAVELIEGTLHRSPDGALGLDLRRVDLQTRAQRGSYRIEGADVYELADRATARLAAGFGLTGAELHVADVTTDSLHAYRFYHDGLRSFGAADYARALQLFEAALAADRGFALAALYTWFSGNALGRPTILLARLDSLAARAPDRERLLSRAVVAASMHDPSYVAVAESLAARYPTEPEAHLQLGVALIDAGDFLAAIPRLRRVIALDSLALRSNRPRCRPCEAFAHLASAYALLDSAAATERVAKEWMRVQPGAAELWPWLSVALAAQGRHGEATTALRTAAPVASRPERPIIGALLSAWIYLLAGDFTAAERVLAELLRTGTAEVRRDALWYQTISLRNQGRLREALETARRREAVALDGHRTGPIQHRAQVLFELGRLDEAAFLFDSLAVAPDTTLRGGHLARYKSWLLTHLATTHAAAGDTAALAALLEPLRAWGPRSSYGRDRRLHHHANGLLLVARGQTEHAAAEFRRAIYSPTLGYTRTNYELGRTLLALGRPREAAAAIAPALRGALDGSNLYITRTELHELLAQAYAAAGEPDSATIHFRAVLAAWQRADPEFHPRRDTIRARLAVLGGVR